jgi:hypothetical protein
VWKLCVLRNLCLPVGCNAGATCYIHYNDIHDSYFGFREYHSELSLDWEFFLYIFRVGVEFRSSHHGFMTEAQTRD